MGMDTTLTDVAWRMISQKKLMDTLVGWILIGVVLLVGAWIFLTALQTPPPFDCELLQSSLRVGISWKG